MQLEDPRDPAPQWHRRSLADEIRPPPRRRPLVERGSRKPVGFHAIIDEGQIDEVRAVAHLHEAAGPGATKFTAGQRVVACPWPTKTGNGTWQQLCAVPESLLLAVPDSVSDEAAAQFLVNPVTVYGFLEVNF